MDYIQQRTQSASGGDAGGGDQAEVMSGAYEVQISDSKHHPIVGIPNDSAHSESADQDNQQHQQTTTQRSRSDSNGAGGDDGNNNHQSSSTSSGEERRDNSSGAEGGPGKTPNSYKYPLLKEYFEFGPWVGRNRKALCLGCRVQSSSSQPDRLLKHLMRCTALSDSAKSEVAEVMNERTANKRKKPMQLKLKRDDNDSEYYGDDEPNTGIADDLTLSNQNSIPIPVGGLKKLRRDHGDRNSQIDEALTRFIMMCRIPLKAIHSREFVELIRSLDSDYHIPSRETITNVLIPGLLNII